MSSQKANMRKAASSKKAVKTHKKRTNKKRTTKASSNSLGSPQGVAVAYSTRIRSNAPRIQNSGKSMRIRHRELVVPLINGGTPFTVQEVIALNPGVPASFPWLAPQAVQWEQYTCHKLCAEYIPIAPTTTQGDIIISPDYDASDPAPLTETEAANNQGTVIDSVWKTVICELDVRAMMGLGPRRYVRALRTAGDIKTFDMGNLNICTNNGLSTAPVGKLYLDYDFEFFVPQNSPKASGFPSSTSFFQADSNQTLTSGVPTTVALPVNQPGFDPLNFNANTVVNVFTPPAGVYLLQWTGDITFSAASLSGVVNIQFLKNGAFIAPNGIASDATTFNSSGAGALSTSVNAVVAFNGSDTFEVNATGVSALGTIIIPSGTAELIVSLA